jgi:hypothetical protein
VSRYKPKGELTRLRAGRYEYVLNGKKYWVHSEPGMTYPWWRAKGGGFNFHESANTLSILVWNIDRSES